MKRIHILVSFIAIAMFSFSVSAQIKLGLKAGLGTSSTSFKGDNLEELKSNFTGFHVGPIVDVTLPLTNFGFDAAILYSQKGFKIKNSTVEERQGALDFPVNLKIKAPLGNGIKLYAAAGPYVSFKLSGDDFKIDEAQYEDLKGQWENKSFAVGANIGGGLIVSHLQIGFNYKVSFSDEYKNLDYKDLHGKSKTWFLELAYFF